MFRVLLVKLAEDVEGAVGAAVVDENDLVDVLRQRHHGLSDFLIEKAQRLLFVEDGNHDREVGRGSSGHAVLSCIPGDEGPPAE